MSSGHGKGLKSRFDDILSHFVFGGNPVALEQQTQGPHISHATQIIPLTVSKPLKKEEAVKHDKKKFKDTKSVIKKYEHLIKLSRTYDKKKFKDALKWFGFRNSPTAGFQGIAPSIVLNASFNQPQLVQVLTSTFTPSHQNLPWDSKRQTYQVTKTSIPNFTGESHTEIRKNRGKAISIKGKTIKKHKNSKTNLN